MAASVTVLFWNVHKKDLSATIARLIENRSLDLLVLAELPSTGPEMRTRLEDETGLPIFYANEPEPLDGKTHLFSRYPSGYTPHVSHGRLGRLNLFTVDVALFPPFVLGTVHLMDARNHDLRAREMEALQIAADLSTEWKQIGMDRLVLCGDFNLNPFDHGMRAPGHFHGVMDRCEVAKGSRTIQERVYPMLYNPMWSLLGDFPSGPPGTYYLEGADHDTTYWHLLDQFLLSPAMLATARIDAVEIVTGDGVKSYLTDEGQIRKDVYSDHLPILLKLTDTIP